MAPDLILFLAANPSNTSRLALDSECSAIERELRMAAHRDFDFQSRWAVTVDELMHYLNALQPTVIHFSGHGIAVLMHRTAGREPGATPIRQAALAIAAFIWRTTGARHSWSPAMH